MGGTRRWVVLAAGLLLTACQPADASAPLAAVPSGSTTGTWTRGSGADVLDVRPGDHRADDAAILTAATAAATAVSRVWGSGWHRPPVVVAVADTATMARLAGRPAAATNGLVAVTTVDRVYLDVPAWLALPPAGRQVLLTHEVTHLATGSAATDLPLWLEEGFADEVALSGSGLTLRAVAAALLDPLAVRRTGPGGASDGQRLLRRGWPGCAGVRRCLARVPAAGRRRRPACARRDLPGGRRRVRHRGPAGGQRPA